MKEKMNLLQEIYDKSGGYNLGELLSIFESESHAPLKLRYKEIYKKDDTIIIQVFDKNSESYFEVYYCEIEHKLKLLME